MAGRRGAGAGGGRADLRRALRTGGGRGEVFEPDGPLGPPGMAAAMELASVGEDVAARWRHDPQEAVALVQELVASGEFTEDEILDDAVDSAVLIGLLTLQEVRTASDPSAAAELCLHAVPHFALAVTLASADLD
ncbi:hypothetical protein [Streptomyces sp. SID685]|uniref:hypothetical protein n=1 Tax=Streptomyces sp. SID685 TaxID=2690322 RepID=UPI001F30049B|nr:hypothetical protein [Streptomyces sp. SID685]